MPHSFRYDSNTSMQVVVAVVVVKDAMESCVPPGFRFHPTDEELVGYYLRKKVASQKIDLDVIRDIDLYRIEPWDLQEHCRIGYEEQSEWYFFSYKDRKYPTGTRTNRATMAGFWKATGRDKAVHEKSRLIGMRKTLVFYKGRAPNGQKSDWIMHEYRLETDENGPPQEEGWVVCRAFKKRTTHPAARSIAETWDSNYSYHEPTMPSPALADVPSLGLVRRHPKAELDGLNTLQYSAGHLVELPQLESPSAPLAEEDADSAGGRRAAAKASTPAGMAVTDWRALDRFVASQLSPGECGGSETATAAAGHGVADDPDMAALLFLDGGAEEQEAERWAGLLGAAGDDCDLGICVFEK